MSNVHVLAIDLAKRSFQVCAKARGGSSIQPHGVARRHQARAVAFRTHRCFFRQRTLLINALRGHLVEFGIVVA